MAYALRLPKDVTDLIVSMSDWRYDLVRAGGKTPSAQCMPELITMLPLQRPLTDVVVPGKLYMQRMDFSWYRDGIKTPCAVINIWKGVANDEWPRSRSHMFDGVVVRTFPDVCRANQQFG